MKTINPLAFLAIIAFLYACDSPEKGADGNTPCARLSGYEIIMKESPVDDQVSKQLEVTCPEGKFALGAGWSVEDSTGAILEGEATHFQLSYDGKGYLVNAKNNSSFSPNWKLRVRCVCADICK